MRFTHESGRSLDVDDVRLYVEEAGDPTGLPVVLLHGGLGSLVDFNFILDGMPSGLRLLGIDLRGHGRSTLGTAPLCYERYQRDVELVLDQLAIDHATLVGFSDGGIVALRIAAHAPDRVRALVTVGAQWKLDVGGPVDTMLRGLTAEAWAEMSPESVRRYEAVSPAPDLPTLIRAVIAAWTDETASGYPRADVARIEAPCLLVRGDQDPLLSLRELTELQEQLLHASVFNVPFAGHEVHRDAPHLFLAVLRDFLVEPRQREREW